jgi:NADPH-dependent glutamate synthase beta subunit-like oxidoreductase/NAD(P)H-flavin reductase
LAKVISVAANQVTSGTKVASANGGPRPELALGLEGFTYPDFYIPERLADLHRVYDNWFKATAPEAHGTFEAYRRLGGKGMTPLQVSDALLAAAPFVSAFLGKLFGIESELLAFREEAKKGDPIWKFKRDFVKKRVLRADAGKAWSARALGPKNAELVAQASLDAVRTYETGTGVDADEELQVARSALLLLEIDDVARKAAKAGGAEWTEELRVRTLRVRSAIVSTGAEGNGLVASTCAVAMPGHATDEENARVVAFALDAVEAWLAHRRADHFDSAHRWPSFHAPKNLEFEHLVELRRPDPTMPELFVGPDHERRERGSFTLTDRRGSARKVEEQIDYCLLCHDRDKDSCSKGLRDNKTKEIRKNPLGVLLNGCPLEEKISEMHSMRREGLVLAAMALVCIDNPMCPGTGHRICNDCMKACVFQKQEPVDIPQIETRVLTETLHLPWGLEIYGLLTRWNPLNIARPYAKPYSGRNALVVGLGPAGYTLAHHLACEGIGVVAVDGLKLEPLPVDLVGDDSRAPAPIRDFAQMYTELDERILLGFGGVSEYGITVRWDKNFLTVLYVTLARQRLLRTYGGVRFGGTLTLDDAWDLGFDHVAIAAGAGRPTLIDIKNNLARGIRKASDFLMGLQLSGAYKKSSIANLQISLPAVVIGGGLTAIDTATELLAYYCVQVEKEGERYDALVAEKGELAVRGMFDDEEWGTLSEHLVHARALAAEKAAAATEGRTANVQALLDSWGGVTLVYRKSLKDSPAYRLNHEEVAKSLEEGVRYIENLSPTEAILDEHDHVKAMRFVRHDGTVVDLPARTVCVAAGTSPNVTYEKEYEGTFKLDARKQFFQGFRAQRNALGEIVLEPVTNARDGFFTSYLKGHRTVSFYGDNHPHYAGSVVKAMASAKDGHSHVAALFAEVGTHDPMTGVLSMPAIAGSAGDREAKLRALFARTDSELIATVLEVNRLTPTIVEVVVKAPMAARKFQPGQFYRLQNFESLAPIVSGTRLAMEGLALTGAWIDLEKGLMGTIVLEMGGSSRLCAALTPGEPVVLMGPTGAPTEIQKAETVLLCGGGLGNAVLFSIARAFKATAGKVLYFAGYKKGEDLFKQSDIEQFTDQVIWTTDSGAEITPRRSQDRHFRGNIVEAMRAYGNGELGPREVAMNQVTRIIAIGSDRMMNAVREARHGVLLPLLNPRHLAIGSINSPMQCMMKEVCAQCLQKHRDPETGKEFVVFSCFNQDQELDRVDFTHLNQRLRANSMQEKLSSAWLERVLTQRPELLRI